MSPQVLHLRPPLALAAVATFISSLALPFIRVIPGLWVNPFSGVVVSLRSNEYHFLDARRHYARLGVYKDWHDLRSWLSLSCRYSGSYSSAVVWR